MNQILSNWKLSLLYIKTPLVIGATVVVIFMFILLVMRLGALIETESKTRHEKVIEKKNKYLYNLVRNRMNPKRKERIKKILALANDPRTPEEFSYDILNSTILTLLIVFLADAALITLGKISRTQFLLSAEMWRSYILAVILLPGFVAFSTYNDVVRKADEHKEIILQQLPSFTRLILLNLYSGNTAYKAVQDAIQYLPKKGLKEDIKEVSKIRAAQTNLTRFFELLADRINVPSAQRFFNSLTVLDKAGDTEIDRRHVIDLLEQNLLSYDKEREYRIHKIIQNFETPFVVTMLVFFVGAFIVSIAGSSFMIILHVLGG